MAGDFNRLFRLYKIGTIGLIIDSTFDIPKATVEKKSDLYTFLLMFCSFIHIFDRPRFLKQKACNRRIKEIMVFETFCLLCVNCKFQSPLSCPIHISPGQQRELDRHADAIVQFEFTHDLAIETLKILYYIFGKWRIVAKCRFISYVCLKARSSISDTVTFVLTGFTVS